MGSNYRLTELQAAVGLVQMNYLTDYLAHRNRLAKYFSERIGQFAGITPPVIKEGCEHAFYLYPMKFDEKKVGVSRKKFVEAVHAELPKPEVWEQTPFVEAYIRPLYLNQIYQQQIAIGKKGFPFTMNPGVKYNYQKGICPVVENMFENTLFHCPLIREAVTEQDLGDVLNAVEKVMKNIDQLRD
jgi:dTDP-4-amino-4,6-dideoxygalactose transaminase